MGDVFGAIGQQLLAVVLPALATVIGGLLVGLLNKQLKKSGIELTQAQQDRVTQLVQDAIRATEEAARRQQMSGPQKRAKTIAAATKAIASEKSIPDASPEAVASSVDTQLQVVRHADAVPAAVTMTPAMPVTVSPGR